MGLLHFQHRPVHHISSVHSWWQISIKLIWIALEVKLPQSSLPLRIWNPCQLLHHICLSSAAIYLNPQLTTADVNPLSIIAAADCVSQLRNSWVDPDKSTPAHKDAVSKMALLVLCFHVLWWTPATVLVQESSTNARFRPILVSGSGGASRLLVFQYGIFKIGYIFKYDIQQKNLQIYPVCIWQWLPLHKVCPLPLLLCAKSRTIRLLFSSSFLCCFVFIVCIYTHAQAQLCGGAGFT